MMRRRKPRYVHEYLDCRERPRIYLRKPKQRVVPLPGPLYSDDFWTAYHAAMKAETPVAPVGLGRNKPGSLSAIITGYYGSAEYKTKAESTKQSYRRVLEKFREKH